MISAKAAIPDEHTAESDDALLAELQCRLRVPRSRCYFLMNTSQRARQSSLLTIASTAATWTCTTLRQTLSQRDAGIGTASLSTLSVTWPAYASAAAAAATAAISRGRLCVWMYRVPACWLHQGQLRELLHRLHHG